MRNAPLARLLHAGDERFLHGNTLALERSNNKTTTIKYKSN
jgi:hypothetical protein